MRKLIPCINIKVNKSIYCCVERDDKNETRYVTSILLRLLLVEKEIGKHYSLAYTRNRGIFLKSATKGILSGTDCAETNLEGETCTQKSFI